MLLSLLILYIFLCQTFYRLEASSEGVKLSLSSEVNSANLVVESSATGSSVARSSTEDSSTSWITVETTEVGNI